MKTMTKILMGLVLAMGLFGMTENRAQAQPAGYVYHSHYHEAWQAAQVAQSINAGNHELYDAGWAENVPHRVTKTYGVYARRRVAPAVSVTPGQLTRAHPQDRMRPGRHAVVYEMNLPAGQAYQFDVSSPRGPGHFDTWLRIEDAQGNELKSDDDSGEGLDARIVFTAPNAGVYRIVVSSFSAGATGNYVLTVR